MLVVIFGHAFNMHFIHILAKKVNPFVNIYYTHMCLIILNSLMCNIYPSKPNFEGNYLWFLILLIGIVIINLLSQYGIILANSIKNPSLVMPFGYVGVLVGFIGDIYLFDSTFSWMHIIGVILLSCGLLSG